jgi:hypothetical protein
VTIAVGKKKTATTVSHDAPPRAKTSKTAAKPTAKGISALAVDGVESISSEELQIRSLSKKPKASSPDSIPSAFPLDDLGQIETTGRWAQGFRLDSGSLRLMWMTARRIEEDGKKGYEVYFQAHSNAVEQLKERLEEKGAKQGSFTFQGSRVDDDAPAGKAVHKKTDATWSPYKGKALELAQEGKWNVSFVPSEPETIKGACRIQVFGTDKAATKALKDVIDTLGLHSAFAPPTPNALEKFKLFRLLWMVAPQAADTLRWRRADEVKDLLEGELEKIGIDPHGPEVSALSKVDLEDEEIAERMRQVALLYEKSPKAFLEYAKDQGSNVFTNTGSSWDLDDALEKVKADSSTKEHQAAIDKGPFKQAEARPLLLLGLLVQKDPGAAERLLGREVEQIKLEDLRAVLSQNGVDPDGDRVKALRFEEVYPGYFTVIDPSMAERMHQAGARYLYSTSNNPERVWQQLTGGQKSSLTRFQDGILIEGMSSSEDFNTGGGFCVFTRLVTESVIQEAKSKKDEDNYWGGGDTSFNDWGGERPYKLILNRKVLSRLDWYGHTDDEYGRSTGLTRENKGEHIIQEINSNYSSSNELMFPVGSDGSFVDFVVAGDEEEKKELIAFLKKKGIKEWNGKSLETFVRVGKKFFEHPEDMTLAQAVKDAIYQDGLESVMKKAETAARKVAAPKIDEAAKKAADKAVEKTAKETMSSHLGWSVTSAARESAKKALSETDAASGLKGLEKTAKEAAAEAATAAAKKYLSNVDNYYLYNVTDEIRSAVQDAIDSGRNALIKLAKTGGKKAVVQRVNEIIESKAKVAEKSAAEQIKDEVYNAQYDADDAAREAAMEAVRSEAKATVTKLQKIAVEPAKDAIRKAAKDQLTVSPPYWLTSSVRSAASTAAEEMGKEALTPAVLEAVKEQSLAEVEKIVASARKAFEKANPDKKKEPEAQIEAAANAAIEELSKQVAERIAEELAPDLAEKHAEAAVKSKMAGLADEAAEAVAKQKGAEIAKAAVDDLISQVVDKAIASDLGEKAAEKAHKEVKPELVQKLVKAAMKDVKASEFDYEIDDIVETAKESS